MKSLLRSLALALLFVLPVIVLLPSCTAPAAWEGTPNPLDTPGDSGPATAEELHNGNLANITDNPAYR